MSKPFITTTITIGEDHRREAKKLARHMGLTMSGLVRWLIMNAAADVENLQRQAEKEIAE